MKKIVSLTFVFAFSFAAIAQQKGFQLGLQLSPNISWFKPDSDGLKSDGVKLGFSYGIIGDFNISENYAISTGISLLSAGGKLNYPDREEINGIFYGGRTTSDIRLKYIQIPLTIKLKTNQIGYMRYYGQFGFGAAFNYDSKIDREFSYPESKSNFTTDNKKFGSEVNIFRASLIVGIGAEYNLSGNTSLLFGLTFDNGFMNVLSKDIYPEDQNGNGAGVGKGKRSEDFNAINNSLVLNFGVLF